MDYELPSMELDVSDLLGLRGFSRTKRTRFVRHQDDRYPVEELKRHAWLENCQSYQSRPVFHNADQIVAFCGLPGSRATFYGVYEVGEHRPAEDGLVLPGCPWSEEWREENAFFYELKRRPEFDDFQDRLVIEWGRGTRSFVQKASNKRVLEVRAPGRSLPLFDDYLDFCLSFRQLQDLFAHEEAHSEWRARLSAVGGVYLILAKDSGDLYVGSASGERGIWGRWQDYAKNGHGGNALLQKLVTENPTSYPERFLFSILQIGPRTMARDEVLRREALYKTKLGTRARGLNLN
jgi:hypothetical protein